MTARNCNAMMHISGPENDGQARITIPKECTAAGARGYKTDTAANLTTVSPANVAIVWTNVPPLWCSCRSRARLTIITTPCHFTANATMVLYSGIRIEIFCSDSLRRQKLSCLCFSWYLDYALCLFLLVSRNDASSVDTLESNASIEIV